jgi:hypothetical protein
MPANPKMLNIIITFDEHPKNMGITVGLLYQTCRIKPAAGWKLPDIFLYNLTGSFVTSSH